VLKYSRKARFLSLNGMPLARSVAGGAQLCRRPRLRLGAPPRGCVPIENMLRRRRPDGSSQRATRPSLADLVARSLARRGNAECVCVPRRFDPQRVVRPVQVGCKRPGLRRIAGRARAVSLARLPQPFKLSCAGSTSRRRDGIRRLASRESLAEVTAQRRPTMRQRSVLRDDRPPHPRGRSRPRRAGLLRR